MEMRNSSQIKCGKCENAVDATGWFIQITGLVIKYWLLIEQAGHIATAKVPRIGHCDCIFGICITVVLGGMWYGNGNGI
jgi:hypothetical protein